MVCITEETEYFVYEALGPENLSEGIQLISETFSNKEPLTRYCNINHQEFIYFAEIHCRQAATEGLGVLARNKATSQLEGFLIGGDLHAPHPKGYEQISPKFFPIMAVLETLSNGFKHGEKTNVNEYFHIFMTGISKECRHREVSQQVIKQTMKLAKQQGYKGALGESTSTLAVRSAKRSGFRPYETIRYCDFLMDGKEVFKEFDPKAGCTLMVQKI